MKLNTTSRFFLGVVALAIGMLGACDDTMEGTTTIGFPTDTLTFTANPGDTVSIPFNVGFNWKLSSNKSWCRTDGAMNVSGQSGKHTVPFVITEEGHDFVDERAEIMLRMNDESRLRAYITRRAKGYFMEVSGTEGVYTDSTSIVLGTSGSVKLNVKTNFESSQLRMSHPKWLTAKRNGDSLTLEVVEEYEKFSINSPADSLILYKSDSTFSRGFHVCYVGMDKRAIRISPQIDETLIVSQDAKRCHAGKGDSKKEYKMPIPFTITALNDGYKLVSMAYDELAGCSVMTESNQWFTVVDKGCGDVELLFAKENTELEARTAYMLALPKAVADSLRKSADGYDASVVNFLCNDSTGKKELKEEAKQYYCMVEISQDGLMSTEIEISPETRWDLKVSVDGKTYSGSRRGELYEAPVTASIDTDRGYELVCANYDSKVGCTIETLENSWLRVTDDKNGSVEVNFKENDGDERTIYLFALPLPVVESLQTVPSQYTDTLSTILFEEMDGLLRIKADAAKYLIAEFVQDANEDNSMAVYDRNAINVEVVKETDADWLAIAAEKGVSSNKVFHCSMKLGYAYTINPLLPLSVWDSGSLESKDRIEIYGKSGKKYESGVEYKEEHTMMEEIYGEYLLVTLTEMRKYVKEDFIVYFIDNDTNYLKALVVTLANN